MLKTVVQEMQLWAESVFREEACFVAIVAHNYRNAQASRYEERFVTKIL